MTGDQHPIPSPLAVIIRLAAAVNDHNLEALVSCFAPHYVNETPAHPDRSFSGTSQVRRNWERMFSAVPDLSAELIRTAVDQQTVWTEWEHRGIRTDGSSHLVRGVVIFTVADCAVTHTRFFLEPVEHSGPDADGAVTTLIGTEPSRTPKESS